MHNFFCDMFIWILYMFRAILCSSSGGLTKSDYTGCCITTIFLLKVSTNLLETCRGFKQTYCRRNYASSWLPTRIIRRYTVRKIWKFSRVFSQSTPMLRKHFWISSCQLLPDQQPFTIHDRLFATPCHLVYITSIIETATLNNLTTCQSWFQASAAV
jgi:hypothetical protein